MDFKMNPGVWPTMITPFTEDGKVDYKAIPAMVDWYIEKGCTGIFAVCQSSEMFFLTLEEKLSIAKAVLDASGGRVQVIASGHTADDRSEQIEQLGKMSETGVDAVVTVSNRFAKEDEGADVFDANYEYVAKSLPGVSLGMYECPYPYKRLATPQFLRDQALKGNLVFLKDTCCSMDGLNAKLDATRGTGLSLFNANAATLLDSLKAGATGYNGVMANLHPDIYNWMYRHYESEPEKAFTVAQFLTFAACFEARMYPIIAKYHMRLEGIPMSIYTRSRDYTLFGRHDELEVEALFTVEKEVRKQLGL